MLAFMVNKAVYIGVVEHRCHIAAKSVENFKILTRKNTSQIRLNYISTSLFTKVGSNTTNKLQTQHCEKKKKNN